MTGNKYITQVPADLSIPLFYETVGVVTDRQRLPNRRANKSFLIGTERPALYCDRLSRFTDTRITELFLNDLRKFGNQSDTNARDAAILLSFALQRGAELQTIQNALCTTRLHALFGIGEAINGIARHRRECRPTGRVTFRPFWHAPCCQYPADSKKSHKCAACSNALRGMTRDAEEIRRDSLSRRCAHSNYRLAPLMALYVIESDHVEGHGVDGAAWLEDLRNHSTAGCRTR